MLMLVYSHSLYIVYCSSSGLVTELNFPLVLEVSYPRSDLINPWNYCSLESPEIN